MMNIGTEVVSKYLPLNYVIIVIISIAVAGFYAYQSGKKIAKLIFPYDD